MPPAVIGFAGPIVGPTGSPKTSNSEAAYAVGRHIERALEHSREIGRAVTLRVEVEPNGRISVEAPSTSSALDGALDAARARGAAAASEVLRGPEMLNSDAFARVLGTTRETVLRKRERREVLGLSRAVRGWRFPDWQIGADGRPFDALPALHAALGDEPWAVYRFLTTDHGELGGRTGLAMLQAGKADRVLAAASAQARHFA